MMWSVRSNKQQETDATASTGGVCPDVVKTLSREQPSEAEIQLLRDAALYCTSDTEFPREKYRGKRGDEYQPDITKIAAFLSNRRRFGEPSKLLIDAAKAYKEAKEPEKPKVEEAFAQACIDFLAATGVAK